MNKLAEHAELPRFCVCCYSVESGGMIATGLATAAE